MKYNYKETQNHHKLTQINYKETTKYHKTTTETQAIYKKLYNSHKDMQNCKKLQNDNKKRKNNLKETQNSLNKELKSCKKTTERCKGITKRGKTTKRFLCLASWDVGVHCLIRSAPCLAQWMSVKCTHCCNPPASSRWEAGMFGFVLPWERKNRYRMLQMPSL